MGWKDHKLFPMEQISVTKIQGRANMRHQCAACERLLRL